MTAPIIILGAGPAGLAAAEAASANGKPVLLIDENSAPGGQIWRGGPGHWQDGRARRLWEQLSARPQVRMLWSARVAACGPPGTLLVDGAAGDGGAQLLAWERVIICSGARELLLPFPGWTLPGVTGAGGLQALIKGGVPLAGRRVVVAGSGPLLLAVAASVLAAGGELAAIVEQRSTRELLAFGARLALGHQSKAWQALRLFARLRGIPYLRGASLTAAHGAQRLVSVTLHQRGAERVVECDFAACGYGLLPALETAALFGCAFASGAVRVDAAQRTSVDGVWAAGESTGIGGVDKALAEGRIAGLMAAGCGASGADRKALASARRFAALLARSFAPTPAMRALCTPATIVCRCEDVTAAELSAHDGWRAAKLQTRVGMGPCQGRVCGAACQLLYGWDAGPGRPPVFPITAGALASVP
jgi:NADPH-dependent 2,4-dienoyl-CoA reductase/sulfur reductase-like enzyme